MLKQCSRSTPEYGGEWTPQKDQIEKLETNLSKLSALVKDINLYKRQYVGIISNGKQLIYINAIISDNISPPFASKSFDNGEPLILCDGGKNSWGAVYDPSIEMFSQVLFNGTR